MALSPMMQHYLQIKENYKDCIVFYRLGDFYEMFFDDAIKASTLLDLTLTGRDCGLEERAPMCGVPFHAADNYITKLVSFGEKVAICEQLTEANGGKTLVQRDVIKVVTAGTVINNELIDDRTNNFLASVYQDKNKIGLSWVDITTGEFFTRSFSGEKAISSFIDTLVKIAPVEIIANNFASENFSQSPLVQHGILPNFNTYADSTFNVSNAKNCLEKHFNTLTLQHFGIESDGACISASGALLSYLNETQKHALINITSLKKESADDIMMLDINAIKNLELVKTLRDGKRYGSLLWLLDKTKTGMGARKLQSWILSPLNDIDKINYRLNGVEDLFKNTLIRESISELLSAVKDVYRIAGKISNGNLMPKDCVALRNSLEVLPSIKFQLLGLQSNVLCDVSNSIFDFTDTAKLLKDAITDEPPTSLKDGGYIKKGYNVELDELRLFKENSTVCIAEIENRERERTGIKNLRIGYNRVFGYFIEVTNSFKEKVPYDYVRRQTLANAERYITEELKDLEFKILSSEEKFLKLELSLYNEIKEHLACKIVELKDTADALSVLDVLVSLARVAKENNYTKPTLLDSSCALNLVDSRHPVVERTSKQKFIANDCSLDTNENRMMIITGPNMAGKSTYMRQVALITLMAHIGCFVPAKYAEIPLTDKIFTRIGASDNLILDQSTFMVEMTEVASILNNATPNSLIILDEIGRGTSTYDGLSIAWAVVEHVCNNLKAKTIFATHYHELTSLENTMEGVKNFKITVKEIQGGIVFLRKIMRGGANRSFGIEVAELAGVNTKITDRAKEILKQLEKSNLLKNTERQDFQPEQQIKKSEIERIVCDLDLNNLSPMQAFNVLVDLQEKVKDR